MSDDVRERVAQAIGLREAAEYVRLTSAPVTLDGYCGHHLQRFLEIADAALSALRPGDRIGDYIVMPVDLMDKVVERLRG